MTPYYLVTLQRAALAANRRELGTDTKLNWYEAGRDLLLKNQDRDGSWGKDVPQTALSVLFLATGGVK